MVLPAGLSFGNIRSLDVMEFGMIPVVGAVCDRAFFRPAESCSSGRKDARWQTAPTIQAHSVFQESLDSLGEIRTYEHVPCVTRPSALIHNLTFRSPSVGP